MGGFLSVGAISVALPRNSRGEKWQVWQRHVLAAIAALLIVLSAFSPGSASASGAQGSTPPVYFCAGGLCSPVTTPCPNGSISAFRICSEAHYAAYLEAVDNAGWLKFLYVSFDSYSQPHLWWLSQYGGLETSFLGIVSNGQDAPAVDRNLGFKGCASCGGTMVGDPVNLATGNEFADEGDYEGEGSFPLSFHRYYNSAGSGDGTIGNRWGHTYSRMLAMQSLTEVKLFRDDGEIRYFNQCGSAWCATVDEIGTLTEQTDSNGNILGWRYTNEHNVTEAYDGSGRFVSEADSTGLSHTLTYDSSGRLSTIADAFGRTLTLTYNASNLLSQLILPDGQQVAYSYDSTGNFSSAIYPGNLTRTYLYDESANVTAGANPSMLTGIQDETGQRFATYQYDAKSRANLSEHAGNADLNQFAYNLDGTATVTDGLGEARNYAVQAVVNVNHLSTVSGSGCSNCGLFANYAYNAAGDFTSTTDFNGNKTLYTIDPNHLLDSRVEASGTPSQRTTNFTWNTTLRVPLTRVVLDANGNTVSSTQWVYNSVGQTLARCEIDPTNSAASGYACSNTGTVPAGVRRWTYTYCAAVDTAQCPIVGLMLTATGPRTDTTQTTTYSYYLSSGATNCGTPGVACYQAGNLHTITDPAGHVTTIASYDADGRVTRLTDANGLNTDTTYTPRGWVASRSVGGATSKFTYTAYGAVQTVTDPDGVTTTYGYNAAHRLVKITDAQGNYLQYTLDNAGNKTAEQVYDSTGTLHKSLSRTFNPLGQLTKVMDGLSHTVFDASASNSYDANGNLVQSADGLGIQRQQGYDALNRLVQTLDNYNGTN
ncbi:DUF6531 domain-containing protein [Dyella choica]|nr:DUF6531 domain-containing protein [Dyella choica]